MVSAMASPIDGLDTILQEARKLSEEQAGKQYANKNSLDVFISFLEEHKADAMKKYARTYAHEKEKFECLIRDKIVIPGDIVCFFRKHWTGLKYAHAAIFGGGGYVIKEMKVAHIQHIFSRQHKVQFKISKQCEVRLESLASERTLKQVAGWFVPNHQKALELVRLMDERFANPSTPCLSLEGKNERLVTM